MAGLDLERFLERSENCPSEAMLDRLHWGELEPGDQSSIEAHITGCPACKQRMLLRKKGFDAFDEVDPIALRKRIENSTKETVVPIRWILRRRLAAFGAAAAAVAAVLLVVVLLRSPAGHDEIRAMGGMGLLVFREHDGGVAQAMNGERFFPGDRLRFVVDLPSAGNLMVVGLEQSGRMYMGFPADGSTSSRPVKAGRGQKLAGAIRLDESTGREWIYLVLCEKPFSLGQLRARGAGKIEVPEHCLTRSFEMKKTIP
jgi:hypothetical protein